MKFGLLLRPQDPPRAEGIARRWQETLHAAEVAEEAGFDGVFVPEHHMEPDGHLPAPLVACAALAARTHRVEIGTTILLLPYYHPVHVAEQAAMVDIISGGRMRLGVGLGATAAEFDLFGVSAETQISRFEESVDLVRQAWSGSEMKHVGRHFSVAGRISPTPMAAELWMGAMSGAGVRRAARLGAPWVADSLHNFDVIRTWAKQYQAAGQEYATTDRQHIVLLRDGWVTTSLDEAERHWWPHIRDKYWSYFEQAPQWVLDREPSLRGVTRASELRFDRHRIDRLIVGAPDDCIATIKHLRATFDVDYLVMSFRMAVGPDHADEVRCIRQFGAEVIPAFS
ncbi:LLM class flavin-dependent oxidoreductase [Nocardia vinacea]|uniref:LLM class flavin-dependent oxidoreductase n=1 Tax=Nocardia vinacea TaxID=96468 RepID=UPI00031520D3|nr:LLM class flavin-dependent oxidoreductase [Nocardia vinacea]